MSNAYPIELRERAVQAYEAGEGSYDLLAARFRIGSATLERWVQRKRKMGTVAPGRAGGGNFSRVDVVILEEVLAAKPDVTTTELTVAYNRRVGRAGRTHRSSIHRALRRAGYVFKKNARVRPKSTGRTSS